jgi:oligopeptide/dipeptide ABC transporter ATP-binding protein
MQSESSMRAAVEERLGEPVLSIRDLRAQFTVPEGVVRAVSDVSYDLFPSETLGVVGESGSGKTVTVLAALGLLPQPPARVVAGEVRFGGRDLLQLEQAELRRIRGRDIGMVFQDPMTSLNPVFTIGQQTVEALRAHGRALSSSAARGRAIELLDRVGVPQPEARFHQYPSQFSGGMRQRAMIAMAMANRPRVVIADEPTTALDVTVQAQVLEVLVEAQRDTGASMVLITHDLGIIAERADRVVVMYAGRVVEVADVRAVFREPGHPYFLALLASRPSLNGGASRLESIPGSPPNLLTEISGCPFRTRCALSHGRTRCAEETPTLRETAPGHLVACHFSEELRSSQRPGTAVLEAGRVEGRVEGLAGFAGPGCLFIHI